MSFLKNPFRRLSHSTPNSDHQPPPLATYHIFESSKDTLVAKPISSSLPSYTISLATQKGLHDTINVTLTSDEQSNPSTGHCLVHAVRGKFTDCELSTSTNDNLQQVQIHRRGPCRGMKTMYELTTQAHAGLRWVHERGHGHLTRGFMETSASEPSRVLKLIDEAEDSSATTAAAENSVAIARFTGAAHSSSQRYAKHKNHGDTSDDGGEDADFGVLEVYQDRLAVDPQWRELLVLSAVSVYAREEWNRRKGEKVNRAGMAVGTWKGLMSTGIPVAGA